MHQSLPGRTVHGAVHASREEVVARAEAYLRAHLDTPVRVSNLCRIVGRSERGLRDAFYSVRGRSPKRCILDERLRGVRQVLTDPGGAPTTVTDVATYHGFYELGRFAAAYREAFGEPPSETLRRSCRNGLLPTFPTPRG